MTQTCISETQKKNRQKKDTSETENDQKTRHNDMQKTKHTENNTKETNNTKPFPPYCVVSICLLKYKRIYCNLLSLINSYVEFIC